MPAKISEESLADFSGGVGYGKLAARDFTERQWATIEGFVLENPEQLRSQWGLQQVSTDADILWCVQYVGRSQRYLISMNASGDVQWMQQPSSFLTHTETKALTWTTLEAGLDTSLRPLCVIPEREDSSEGWRGALLLNSITIDGTTDHNWVVYQEDGGTNLVSKEYTSHYPNYDTDGVTPLDQHMPLALVGVMWGDVLALGNIRWYDDATAELTLGNSKRYRNGIWLSQGGQVDAFDPLDVVLLPDPELRIKDLIPIDEGLLVMTDVGPSNNGGVYILRGSPGIGEDGPNFDVEPLWPGMGAEGDATFWPEVGAAVWISSSGEVWHTDGREKARIDPDHFGLPRTVDERDFCADYNSWLVVGKQGGLYCARAFEDDMAWTTLIAPQSGYVLWSHHAGQSLYLTVEAVDGDGDGLVYRFNQYTDEPGDYEGSERGQIDGSEVDLSVATRTLESGKGHEATFWHRVGLRARERYTGAIIRDIVVYDGPALSSESNSIQRDLSDAGLDVRYDIIVRAHGPSTEASAKARFQGDLEVEQMSFWLHRGYTRR